MTTIPILNAIAEFPLNLGRYRPCDRLLWATTSIFRTIVTQKCGFRHSFHLGDFVYWFIHCLLHILPHEHVHFAIDHFALHWFSFFYFFRTNSHNKFHEMIRNWHISDSSKRSTYISKRFCAILLIVSTPFLCVFFFNPKPCTWAELEVHSEKTKIKFEKKTEVSIFFSSIGSTKVAELFSWLFQTRSMSAAYRLFRGQQSNENEKWYCVLTRLYSRPLLLLYTCKYMCCHTCASTHTHTHYDYDFFFHFNSHFTHMGNASYVYVKHE